MSDLVLYHETQSSQLCAVHAINTLLQGPYFTEVELAEIAQGLDRKEKAMMMEGGMDSNDFIKFVAEDSSNVSDDGNYSFSVIAEALKVYDIELIPLESPQAQVARDNLVEQQGYICHLQNHWFSARRLGGTWYNLNSFNKHPEPVSDLYLSLFLETMRAEGYTIFWVVGKLPLPVVDYSNPNYKTAKARTPDRPRLNPRTVSDPFLAQALRASMEDDSSGYEQSLLREQEWLRNQQEEEELRQALLLSQEEATASQLTSAGSPNVVMASAGRDGDGDRDEDEELLMAMAMSMPAPGSVEAGGDQSVTAVVRPFSPLAAEVSDSSVLVGIRLLDGSMRRRTFRLDLGVREVFKYLETVEGLDRSRIVLRCPSHADLSFETHEAVLIRDTELSEGVLVTVVNK